MSSETGSNDSSSSEGKRRRGRRPRSSLVGMDSQHSTEKTSADSTSDRPPTTTRNNSSRSSRNRRSEQGSGEVAISGNDGSMDLDDGKKDESGRSLLEQLSLHGDGDQHVTTKSLIRRMRLLCGQIVEDPRVQLGILFLIILNAIQMGVATFDVVEDNPKIDEAFEQADLICLILFTVELVSQLVYRSLSFFTDSWLIFDFVIVVMSWSLESLQIVRAFRIFRAFRLVTRIGTLRELVTAIGAVMPRMSAIAMLLFLIFYIFGVLFTELFGELKLSGNYFGTLDVALFTCMEMMTLEWSDLTRELMDYKPWAWAPIIAFISITGFIVFNLIVAVVCDAVAVVDREAMAEQHPEILNDKQKLAEAQERIWELTETVDILMMRQERLLKLSGMLANEVRVAITPQATTGASKSTTKDSLAQDTEVPSSIEPNQSSSNRARDFSDDDVGDVVKSFLMGLYSGTESK